MSFKSGRETYRPDTCTKLVAAHQAGEVAMAALARGTYPGQRLPRQMLPALSTVGYWDATHDQSWGLREHRNEGIEITYLANGHLDFRVDGKEHALTPGNLTVTRPWQPHSLGNPTVKASRLYWLILDVGIRQPHQTWCWPSWLVISKTDLRDLTALIRENEHSVWTATPEIERCFSDLGDWIDASQTGEPPTTRLTLAINELLVCLLELLRAQKPAPLPQLTTGERSVAMFLDRLRDELAEPWTLELMAESAGLGRTRFAHHCRKLTNLAPMAYLQQLRIDLARKRLATSRDPVTTIAMNCGFGSSSYFSSVFRATNHCSPSEYRQQNRGLTDSRNKKIAEGKSF